MNTTFILGLASVILGGGLAGSIVALWKLKPEGDQIVVSAAKDVVLIQKGAMDDLRQQMKDLESRFSARLDRAEQARWTAETALAECHRARAEIMDDYEAEKARNAELEERIVALESEVATLKAANRRRKPE